MRIFQAGSLIVVAALIGSATQAFSQQNFTGTYEGRWESRAGGGLAGDATLVLKQTENKITGTITLAGARTFGRSPTPLEGTVQGDVASFAATGGCPLRVEDLRRTGADKEGRDVYSATYFCTIGGNKLTLYRMR